MGDLKGAREMSTRKRTSKERGGKPPRGSWRPMIPSWEKEFCAQVCSIPWWKVCETKKIMPLFENVVEWDDSAGKEAFSNAKKRFWAKMNGLPCDDSLPDPDIYIDEINWNSINDADPELLLALEQEPPTSAKTEISEESGGQPVNNCENLVGFSCNQGSIQFPCSGWGDGDERPWAVNNFTVELGRWKGNADDHAQSAQNWNSWDIQAKAALIKNNAGSSQGWNQRDGREKNIPGVTTSGWDDAGLQDWQVNDYNARWGWINDYGNSRKTQECYQGSTEWSGYDHVGRGKTTWSYGNGNGNGRKREGSGWYGSRYNKTTRYQSDSSEGFAMNGGWWNCSGRKRPDHFTHGRTLAGK